MKGKFVFATIIPSVAIVLLMMLPLFQRLPFPSWAENSIMSTILANSENIMIENMNGNSNEVVVNDYQNRSIVTQEESPIAVNVRAEQRADDIEQLLSSSIMVSPNHGQLTNSDLDKYLLIYTPKSNFYGNDNFVLAVVDGIMHVTYFNFSVSVTPINDPPVANNDSVLAVQNTPANIRILDNDFDIDSTELSVTSVSDAAFGVTRIANENGRTVINYLPANEFTGKDSFSYVLVDNEGKTSNATVNIVIINPVEGIAEGNGKPATTTDGDSISLKPDSCNDSPFSMYVSNNSHMNDCFTTEEDMPLTIGVHANAANISNFERDAEISVLKAPQNGSAVVIDNDSAIRYTPLPNFWGMDRFSYLLSTIEHDNSDNIVNGYAEVMVTVIVNSVNDAPIAQAGQDLVVLKDDLVTLNGTASNDPDGRIVSYNWEQLDEPVNLQRVILTKSDSGIVSFKAPEIAEPVVNIDFKLTVLDDNGQSSSDFVRVKITSPNIEILTPKSSSKNQTPVADAGDDQSVSEGDLVILDGSQSSDPDGDSLSYSWHQQSGPDASVERINESSLKFIAPRVVGSDTTLTFSLLVDDGGNRGVDSDSVTIFIRNINQPPSANAGLERTVGEASYVRLDGTHSSDPDGDQLNYHWHQIEGPSVILSSDSSPKPLFKTPTRIVGTNQDLIFKLEVNDGKLTADDSVRIIVQDTIKPPEILPTPDYRKDLVREINQAQQFVYVSMFYIEDYSTNRVLDSLEMASKRGVDVRLAFSEQNLSLYPTIESDLANRDLTYKIVANHAKIVVIDDRIVYVGSANLNKNGLEDNWELSIKSNNPETVKEAKTFINAAWNTGAKIVESNNFEEENFVNGPEFYELLLEQIEKAETVKVIMYEATYNFKDANSVDTELLNEINDAHNRGAELQLLFDNPRYYEAYGGKQFLSHNNIPHKIDDKSTGGLERLHAKAILIDDDTLFIGSQNWNDDSLNSSAEASIVTHDPETIISFLELFDQKWNAGTFIIPNG